MQADWENLGLTADERELERALASLRPAETGIDRERLWGVAEGGGVAEGDRSVLAQPGQFPQRRSAHSLRRWTLAIAGGMVAASVVAFVVLSEPSPQLGGTDEAAQALSAGEEVGQKNAHPALPTTVEAKPQQHGADKQADRLVDTSARPGPIAEEGGGSRPGTHPAASQQPTVRPTEPVIAQEAIGRSAERKPPAGIAARPVPDTNVEAGNKQIATQEPAPSNVCEPVRRAMHDGKYANAVSLIEAALRNGQVEPWMYEAMVLALQADNRPQEEIERAVMSAVEFAQNPADLMHLGAYLTRLDLDQRAIDVFRQVSSLEPLWPEPYMHGLKAAQKIDDVEGIQWATVGILGQAWPAAQADIWKNALYAAKATLEDLRASKRDLEANRFETALDEAVARDCVVTVSWTGDAIVDLMVEEPTGSVCSLRNWRTTSGGVIQEENPASGSNLGQGHTAVYACPKGFSGTYRLLVRRVWGQVTTGKVTVEVAMHRRTSQATRMTKKIPLDKGEALVTFDLADGRRKEKLSDQQVASAAVAQVAVNRQQQILGQQLAAMNDPVAQQQLARARLAAGNGGGNGGGNAGGIPSGPNQGQFPFPWSPNQGAVGYQPVIVTLPEGANMSATAVVSADRRYVRITCVPLFSGVSQVHTFNTVSGETTNVQGEGTGGKGFSQLFGPTAGAQQGGG